MRERITYVQKIGHSVEPSAVKVDKNVITGPEVQAAREDRLTFGLDELPDGLHSFLEGLHELHIRWVSPKPYEAVSPLLARLPPGFHLFFTPGKKVDADSTKLCVNLHKIFGRIIICSTPKNSFTALPSDRFSHTTAYQYYHQLDDLSAFVDYVEGQLCSPHDTACSSRVAKLRDASSLDVSYDTISHALRVTATWPYQSQTIQAAAHPRFRTEVGILSDDKPATIEPHELGISGLLTILGQDSQPSPTLFTFPSRHRDAESTFSAKFLLPTGLHPTLQLRLQSNKPPLDDAQCSPHAYLTLENSIFPDKYQLSDPLFLASKNLTALRYASSPIDLEAPDYVLKTWGSSVLLELHPPPLSETPQEWTAEIPLHLRYSFPTFNGYTDIKVPYPAVFWACTAEEGTKFPTNPFERVNLGYDGLFGPRTVFWHVEPAPEAGGQLINTVRVPVLSLDGAEWVNIGTAAVVLLGFGWVFWKLLTVAFRGAPRKGIVEGEKKRQ
ncbi:PIG-X [Podospora australis]|uniref:Protein PBN1 n=1 Tax=Podospora australis TaxID=1536484 RepID=A0AAN6WYQ1_9PEZI|nr:PIG-X [Podospora australis]